MEAPTAQNRPSYVVFETREVEDVNASREAGILVKKRVDYVLINSLGTDDYSSVRAEVWAADIRNKASRGEYPQVNADFLLHRYEMFKQGEDTFPSLGLDINSWDEVTKDEAKRLVAANIFTVEDLAESSELAFGKIGMNARIMRERARLWMRDKKMDDGVLERFAAIERRLRKLEGTQ